MICLSGTVNELLQGEGGPQVVPLTAVFFLLAFLAATQVAFRTFAESVRGAAVAACTRSLICARCPVSSPPLRTLP